MQAILRRVGRPVAAALLLAAAMPAFGQLTPYGGESPSAALGRHLRAVAASPRNLDALRGAGRAALELGDLDAAVGFFARAEEVAPRDGRTKAGLGSAFTMLQQPGAALRYFADAVSLGVPAGDVARDRGLAHDLRGNWRAAQRDYKLVLASRPDPEVTRRLAVSQAAGGDVKAALATLDPQVRAKDPAAWRVRAFVLAMGGDAAGAQKAVAAVLPPATASGFSPYFRQMAGLSAGQKVAAAQFGSMPGAARTIRMADLMTDGERAARVALESVRVAPPTVISSPPAPLTAAPVRTAGADLNAGRPDQGQAALGRDGDGVPLPVSRTDGPMAGTLVPTRVAVTPTPTPPTAGPATVAISPAVTVVTPPVADAAPLATPTTTSVASGPAVSPAVTTDPVQGPPVPEGLLPAATPATTAAVPAPADTASSGVLASATPSPSQPKVEAVAPAPPPPPRPKVERPAARTVAALRDVDAAPTPERAAAPRHYVQLGIGQDVKALQGDWRRLRARHASLLGGQDAWTAAANRTNRLLIGPFPNAAAAQALVNKLTAGDVSAVRYSSEPGQAINALR